MFDGALALGTDEGAVAVSPGTMPGMVEDLIVLPYGDPEGLAAVERHAGGLAAVLVEPVQSRHPDLQPRDFLLELRGLDSRLDVALYPRRDDHRLPLPSGRHPGALGACAPTLSPTARSSVAACRSAPSPVPPASSTRSTAAPGASATTRSRARRLDLHLGHLLQPPG